MLFVSLLALASFQTAPAAPTVMTITVQKLPASFKQNPVVSLTFNAKGEVASCAAKVTSGSAGVDKAACGQAVANYSVKPEGGKAPAPTDVVIAFETEAPAQ
ncbi:hypothetical protein [Sphingomonas soli]|uniref:hypothetical protein n=1 Tax=Sphingomonas soli TaxID=266127 RepID=UPI0008343790|nr:hypothetical protein [Sphingomonas soli]